MPGLFEDRYPEALAVSDYSLEVNHLYMKDMKQSNDEMRKQFAPVAVCVRAALECTDEGATHSTAFMVDDYNLRSETPDTMPEIVIPRVLQIAGECDIEIDYIAREAACHDLANLALEAWEGNIITSPSKRDGVVMSRDAVTGKRGPRDVLLEPKKSAMIMAVPLYHISRRRKAEGRRWSCPALATIWHLSRLAVTSEISLGDPHQLDIDKLEQDLSGARWSDLSPVLQINPQAAPFVAERSRSILPKSFLGVECAVQEIIRNVFPETFEEILGSMSHNFI